MRWYDVFSRFYDGSLEKLYAEQRRAAADALDLKPGVTVLDLPCGTGQSLDVLAPAVGPNGGVIGVDRSSGMLARARERVAGKGLSGVTLVEADVAQLDAARLGVAVFDRLHVFLGMTAFDDPDAAFERMWALVKPGGRCVIVDAHAKELSFQGRMVNLVAQADIRRRFWEPLEKRATHFSRRELPSLPDHGGQLFLAQGDKPH